MTTPQLVRHATVDANLGISPGLRICLTPFSRLLNLVATGSLALKLRAEPRPCRIMRRVGISGIQCRCVVRESIYECAPEFDSGHVHSRGQLRNKVANPSFAILNNEINRRSRSPRSAVHKLGVLFDDCTHKRIKVLSVDRSDQLRHSLPTDETTCGLHFCECHRIDGAGRNEHKDELACFIVRQTRPSADLFRYLQCIEVTGVDLVLYNNQVGGCTNHDVCKTPFRTARNGSLLFCFQPDIDIAADTNRFQERGEKAIAASVFRAGRKEPMEHTAIDLLKGLAAQTVDLTVAHLAGRLLADVGADCQLLENVLNQIDGEPNRLKEVAAWAAQKASRFKLDLTQPVGIFEAIEMLTLGVQGKLALWNALRVIQISDPRLSTLDIDELASRATEQFIALENMRLQLAPLALQRPKEFVQV